MELHPVPQNIMQVEFQLFGNLTIREFSIIAVGGLIAFVFYSLGLPDFIKWPVIIFFAGGGILIAKYKINDRNLEIYLTSFIAAMSSSQKMIWSKSTKNYELLKDSVIQPDHAAKIISKSKKIGSRYANVSSLLLNDFEIDERDVDPTLDQLLKDMYSVQKIQEPEVKEQTVKVVDPTTIKPKVEPLKQESPQAETHRQTIIVEKPQEEPMKVKNRGFILDELSGESTDQLKASIEQKENQMQSKIGKPEPAPEKKSYEDLLSSVGKSSGFSSGSSTVKTPIALDNSGYNLLSGMVKGLDGKLIEGAVVIIKDQQSNRTVRSMITNALGHFSHTTPLKDGDYIVNVYKDGVNFDTINISANGAIIEPINIQAK